jgi:hypothetical protein
MGDHAAVELMLSLILLLVAVLAARGRLPTQLTTGGLAYEENVAAAEGAERLQGQLDELRGQVESLAELTLGSEKPRT